MIPKFIKNHKNYALIDKIDRTLLSRYYLRKPLKDENNLTEQEYKRINELFNDSFGISIEINLSKRPFDFLSKRCGKKDAIDYIMQFFCCMVNSGNKIVILFPEIICTKIKFPPGQMIFSYLTPYSAPYFRLLNGDYYIHPHISGGSPCLGTHSEELEDALGYNNLIEYVFVIMRFLQHFTPEDAFIHINLMLMQQQKLNRLLGKQSIATYTDLTYEIIVSLVNNPNDFYKYVLAKNHHNDKRLKCIDKYTIKYIFDFIKYQDNDNHDTYNKIFDFCKDNQSIIDMKFKDEAEEKRTSFMIPNLLITMFLIMYSTEELCELYELSQNTFNDIISSLTKKIPKTATIFTKMINRSCKFQEFRENSLVLMQIRFGHLTTKFNNDVKYFKERINAIVNSRARIQRN